MRARSQGLESLRRQELARRQERRALEPAAAALGHRVERAQRFDHVTEELDAQRLVRPGRPHVDQSPAIRELADAAHLDHGLVAAVDQRGQQLALRDPLPHLELDAARLQLCGRQRALHEGQERSHHDEVARAAAELGEDLQPLRGFVVLRQGALER